MCGIRRIWRACAGVVSEGLIDVIARALAKAPADRWASAGAMGSALTSGNAEGGERAASEPKSAQREAVAHWAAEAAAQRSAAEAKVQFVAKAQEEYAAWKHRKSESQRDAGETWAAEAEAQRVAQAERVAADRKEAEAIPAAEYAKAMNAQRATMATKVAAAQAKAEARKAESAGENVYPWDKTPEQRKAARESVAAGQVQRKEQTGRIAAQPDDTPTSTAKSTTTRNLMMLLGGALLLVILLGTFGDPQHPIEYIASVFNRGSETTPARAPVNPEAIKPVTQAAAAPEPLPNPAAGAPAGAEADAAAGAEADAAAAGPLQSYYLALHWLAVNRVGDRPVRTLSVTLKQGQVHVSGRVSSGRYSLSITGVLIPKNKKEFVLDGTISGIPDMSWNDEPERRRETKNRFLFQAKMGRKFWRLYKVGDSDCVCDDNCGNDFCYIDMGF